MNIVVIGGGTHGKFGNDFVNRARQDGHRVLVLSHKKHNTQHPDHASANFTNLENTLYNFCSLIQKIETIDLFLYNSNSGGWPHQENHLHSTATVNESLYIYGFKIHVIIPHALAIEALKKMTDASKIVFMTTDMIYGKEREKYTQLVGYAGGKAYQHQLMIGLANHNDKNVTVSSLSPFFNYDDQKHYKSIFEKAYNYIITHGPEYNCKVFDCWD